MSFYEAGVCGVKKKVHKILGWASHETKMVAQAFSISTVLLCLLMRGYLIDTQDLRLRLKRRVSWTDWINDRCEYEEWTSFALSFNRDLLPTLPI